MAQIFGPRANTLARVAAVSSFAAPLLIVTSFTVFARSDYVTGRGRTVEQNIPFSHRHHAAELGIDCRYCHGGVETSSEAGIPATSTCMTCHSQIWRDADMLKPMRDSFAAGERLHWVPVNRLPDYVYFDHSVHVTNGVACATCHGPVGEMGLTRQVAPLTMGWCLDCHRDPGPHLSAKDAVFSPFPVASANTQAEIRTYLAEYHVDNRHLTDCSVCHR